MEQAEKIDTYTFKSPINLDSSFGCRPVAKKAASIMTLYFYTDNTGFIEWEVPHYDLYESIGLTFKLDRTGKRTLVDYDGVFDLPTQAMDLLEKNGVDVTEMRETLSK
jgi:hypothetical protein